MVIINLLKAINHAVFVLANKIDKIDKQLKENENNDEI
jgi:GTP-binding protein EngB required for normal cell division